MGGLLSTPRPMPPSSSFDEGGWAQLRLPVLDAPGPPVSINLRDIQPPSFVNLLCTLEATLAAAVRNARLLPEKQRSEFVGLYLLAKSEGGQLPKAPPTPADADGWPAVPDAELAALASTIAAAAQATAAEMRATTDADVRALFQLGCAPAGAHELQRRLGLQLCPKAAVPARALELASRGPVRSGSASKATRRQGKAEPRSGSVRVS